MARDDTLELEDFEPSPDDGEYVTRGEFRRMTHLLLGRLQRVERLCFEDELDGEGKVVRPSLENLVRRVDTHIKVLCDYASVAKWAITAAVSIGGALVVWHELGGPLPWLS